MITSSRTKTDRQVGLEIEVERLQAARQRHLGAEKIPSRASGPRSAWRLGVSRNGNGSGLGKNGLAALHIRLGPESILSLLKTQ